MPTVRWLHISDLHLNRQATESRRLRRALPAYLKDLALDFNYVFCTGDLRYAPDGAFSEDTIPYLQSICDAVSVPLENLFIVPGNHDIERDTAERVAAIKDEWDCSTPKETRKYNPHKGVFQGGNLQAIMQSAELYKKTIASICVAQKKNPENKIENFGPHSLIKCKYFNILEVDSTIAYMNGQEKDLVIGTYYLDEALENCDSSKPTIILTHYSFDYLDRDEQVQISALLQEAGARLWLSGHEHNELLRTQRDCFYEFQCGNLLYEDQARACILVGEVNTETLEGTVTAHTWVSPHGWAAYHFVSPSADQTDVYNFSLRKESAPHQNQTRRALRTKVLQLLRENEAIFSTYGPTEINTENICSEYKLVWEKEVIDTIIPNGEKIIGLLESNQDILLDSEKVIVETYKQHINGLRQNHLGTKRFIMDAPRFPVEILTILK